MNQRKSGGASEQQWGRSRLNTGHFFKEAEGFRVLAQPGLYNQTLSQTSEKRKGQKNRKEKKKTWTTPHIYWASVYVSPSLFFSVICWRIHMPWNFPPSGLCWWYPCILLCPLSLQSSESETLRLLQFSFDFLLKTFSFRMHYINYACLFLMFTLILIKDNLPNLSTLDSQLSVMMLAGLCELLFLFVCGFSFVFVS